ncbi:uncharacterized protein AB675_9063 [Cyphellophora attinorum]|uniref:Integral membrane protein n=1 Tax=Cyphellophora attinorum TaxID=1664694 RepID=A0A0N0NNG6_9EURO|nr:uncharacterized protein AB675_9063 [Phialophora attinorum]KPI41591.1 hypothetical protein AB675_9063 [Phialophora attinorum]
MARNQAFAPSREPFQQETTADLQLQHSKIQGPFSFLNPTRALYRLSGAQQSAASNGKAEVGKQGGSEHHGVHFLWRSRDNRKGRHPLVLTQSASSTGLTLPRRTNHPSEVLKVVKRMFTYYPVWDISWLVAYIFTWGSIVWCINGFFSFLPLIRPSSEFGGEVLYGGGITAFIGAVLFFEIGSILLMFEAVNENSAGCFGWAVEDLAGDHAADTKGSASQLVPSTKHCTHHHPNRANLVGQSSKHADMREGKTWQWWPTGSALKTHYFHELGFLASFSQFCGATIFSIAGVTALPGIIDHMSQGLTDGIYWAPQVVGGSGFIVSGTLYMLETQKNWYTPSFGVLGWHIAFWNLIGGVGFTLCGALGFAAGSTGAQYQASCSTFWGSFAFLIGSVLQLYESLQKNPVEVSKDGP